MNIIIENENSIVKINEDEIVILSSKVTINS